MKKLVVLVLMGILVLGMAVVATAAVSDTTDVTCTVTQVRAITAVPGAQSLTVDRLSTVATSSGLTLSYSTDFASDKITVTAAGTGVAGSVLSIQGGDLASYTAIITASTPASGAVLKTFTVAGAGDIADIKFQLDASNVAVGATGLGTPWVYTVTYTIAVP